jgi:tetratricopeptide (TPR) repeat protein
MGPGPVDPWVKEKFGVRATWRNNGTNALMKALISNGFAPMVTQWAEDPWISRISHWRVVQGYDDARGVFSVYDPLRGRIALSYEWFDRNWQPFAYRYLVIHRPEEEPVVKAILGADWSERAVRERMYERARAEAQGRNDSASWLALGEAAYAMAQYREAVAAFEKGLALGSAQGVFTLRSSYSAALRALGRTQDAERVQQQIPSGASGPAVVSADVIAQEQALELIRSLRLFTE